MIYRTPTSEWIEQSLGTHFETSMEIVSTSFDFYIRAADFLDNTVYYIPGNTTTDESIAKQNPYRLLFLYTNEGSENKITNNNPMELLTLLVIGGTAVLIITAVFLLKKKNSIEF